MGLRLWANDKSWSTGLLQMYYNKNCLIWPLNLQFFTIWGNTTQQMLLLHSRLPLFWTFFGSMYHGNLIFIVIWDSHNPKESSRVINNWFLSKYPKNICNNPCNRNRLKDKYLTWRYLAGTWVKKIFFANFPSTWP